MNSINNPNTQVERDPGMLNEKGFPVNKATTKAPYLLVQVHLSSTKALTLQTHFYMHYESGRIYLGDNVKRWHSTCLGVFHKSAHVSFVHVSDKRLNWKMLCHMWQSDLSFLWHSWNYHYRNTPHLIACASVYKVLQTMQISHTGWCTFITLSLFVSLFPIKSEGGGGGGGEMTQICSPLNIRKFVPLASVISLT